MAVFGNPSRRNEVKSGPLSWIVGMGKEDDGTCDMGMDGPDVHSGTCDMA